MSYWLPVSFVTFVVLRRSCSTAHTEGGGGGDCDITGHGCMEEMMERTAQMTSIWAQLELSLGQVRQQWYLWQ
jgi:hypothetical protein